ncbi:DNA-processing protein DprA [Acidisoma sp. 7E03]
MTAPPSDLAAHLRLARTEGVGPVGYRRLLQRFGSPQAALAALPDLARAAGRSRLPLPSPGEIEDEIAATHRLGGRFLMPHMADYPVLLARISDPPPALAVLGNPACLSGRAAGVVGSRNASSNGRHIAADIAAGLAVAGITVVSGMARGIDAAAHEAALQTAGGVTVAAVAGGLDRPYPLHHAALQTQIAERGAVVTEAPLGTEPQARHFPRRNRVIAGLALGIVVVEAARQSGSLITARLALENGREVFAVPGSPLDPRTQGSNDLIRQGAALVENAADVLALLPEGSTDLLSMSADSRDAETVREEPPASPEAVERARHTLLPLLSFAPTSVDDLLRRCQFTERAALVAALLELELGGFVESLPGNRVALLAA